MNNKPVAWIPFAWYCAWLGKDDEPVLEQYEECHPATKQWDNFPDKIIPLYTHPVKELTEDMLWELAERHLDTDDTWGESNVTGIGDFIEAILRKAQEK